MIEGVLAVAPTGIEQGFLGRAITQDHGLRGEIITRAPKGHINIRIPEQSTPFIEPCNLEPECRMSNGALGAGDDLRSSHSPH